MYRIPSIVFLLNPVFLSEFLDGDVVQHYMYM